MENKEERITMLHQIPSPAFFVDNGYVSAVNLPAQQRQILEGTEITTLLATGKEEYPLFREGCLYLTLSVCGTVQSASVTNVGCSHLFVLEQEADQNELKSMALAAQVLRTSLSSVMNTAEQLFPQTATEENPLAREQTARINRGLYQMLRVICNMSDAYRYQGENILRGEIRDISALIQAQMELAAPLVAQAGTTLRYNGLKETVYTLVDVEKLERAISNILSNAVKFSPPGAILDARLSHRGRMVCLTVSDNGPGMPAQVAGNVYTRYQRAPGLEDSRFGLGLGMVMIRAAAAAHGGTVLTERGQDFGMRLTMTIPIRQTSDTMVRTPMIHVDYASERDHLLLELSDCLPPELYEFE